MKKGVVAIASVLALLATDPGKSAAEEFASRPVFRFQVTRGFPTVITRFFFDADTPIPEQEHIWSRDRVRVRRLPAPDERPLLYLPGIRIVVPNLKADAIKRVRPWRRICREEIAHALADEMGLKPSELPRAVFAARKGEKLRQTLARAVADVKPDLYPDLVVVVGGQFAAFEEADTELCDRLKRRALRDGLVFSAIWLTPHDESVSPDIAALCTASGGTTNRALLNVRFANTILDNFVTDDAEIARRIREKARAAIRAWIKRVRHTTALVEWETSDFRLRRTSQERALGPLLSMRAKWGGSEVDFDLGYPLGADLLARGIRSHTNRYRAFLHRLDLRGLDRHRAELVSHATLRTAAVGVFDAEIAARIDPLRKRSAYTEALALGERLIADGTRETMQAKIGIEAVEGHVAAGDAKGARRLLAGLPAGVRSHAMLAGAERAIRIVELIQQMTRLRDGDATPETIKELRRLRDSKIPEEFVRQADELLLAKVIEAVNEAADGRENTDALRLGYEYRKCLDAVRSPRLDSIIDRLTLQRLAELGRTKQHDQFLKLHEEVSARGEVMKPFRAALASALSGANRHKDAEEYAWSLVAEQGFGGDAERLWDSICVTAIEQIRKRDITAALAFAHHAATRPTEPRTALPRYRRLQRLAVEVSSAKYILDVDRWLHANGFKGATSGTPAERFTAALAALNPALAMTILRSIMLNEPAESPRWALLWTQYHAVVELATLRIALSAVEQFAIEVGSSTADRACRYWTKDARSAHILRDEGSGKSGLSERKAALRVPGTLHAEAWLVRNGRIVGSIEMETRLPGRDRWPRSFRIDASRFQYAVPEMRAAIWAKIEFHTLHAVRKQFGRVGPFISRLCFDADPAVVEARLERSMATIFDLEVPRYLLWVPKGSVEPIVIHSRGDLPRWLLRDRTGNEGRGEGVRTCGRPGTGFDEFICAVVADKYSNRTGVLRIGFNPLPAR